jgi:hypothetical protein
MSGKRLFRLTRTAAMAGATVAMGATLSDLHGSYAAVTPNGKMFLWWGLSCLTFLMVWAEHRNNLLAKESA